MILGISGCFINESLLFNSSFSVKDELFIKSKRLIQIYSSSLDKRILSNREIELSITKLIRSSRNAKIQCIIYDAKELQGFDHRIVSLAQRFTSLIDIKIIPDDYKNTISRSNLSLK